MSGSPNVIITLTVDAKALYDADPQPTNDTEIIPYCTLSDDHKGSNGGKKKITDFTTTIVDGNMITWVGKSKTNASYKVSITSITNNPAFFVSAPSSPSENSGKMTATVKDGIGDVLDTYTIGFSIKPPSGVAKPYSVDPKIQGKSKTTT